MSKGKAMAGNSTSHTLVWRDVADTMSYRMDGEKHTTSTECQTIRIVGSSDMDDWEAVLRPMCKSC